MNEITLPKTGGMARIGILEDSDLPEVLELHKTTRAVLPANMKRFLLPQNSTYFQNFLSRLTGLMVGIRAEGKLVAQMALMGPMTLSEGIAARVITHNDVPFHHASLNDSVIVLKSLATHPDWRGNDLAKNLLSYAIEMPFTRVVDHLFTQISVRNKRSWDTFVHHGFGVVGAAYDPDDKMPRFVFQRPTLGFDFESEIIVDGVDPMDDFPAIVSLTQREGLVGVYPKDSNATFNFMRSTEEISLMPVVARVNG